ncbi:MAG: PHP domain-containing protein [Bacteroidota bacterium]
MPFVADLHLHSTASDGRLSPTDVIRQIAASGLGGASLTDHDTTDGLEEARTEAERLDIAFVSGIEISSGDGRREIHILGYGIDPIHPTLAEYRRHVYRIRRDRLLAIVERLHALGHEIDRDDVLNHVGEGMPGRPHVARAMVEAAVVDTEADAFRFFLRDGGAAFVPKPVFMAEDAIHLIRRAGGIAVLAHPGHHFTDYDILQLKGAGLGGIETSHPAHTPDLEAYYRAVCDRYGLMPTGGSDFHGRHPEEQQTLGRYGVDEVGLSRLRRCLEAA